jgi:hypothetical protein
MESVCLIRLLSAARVARVQESQTLCSSQIGRDQTELAV